jgi:ribosomal protein S12 methylthiotransferase accessory factor
MEHGIPSLWALAKSREPGKLNLLCAAGAHPDAVSAAKSAIHELAGAILHIQAKFDARKEELAEMLDDPYQVQQMEDHALLYGLPQAEQRLHFLLGGQKPLQTFGEAFKHKSKHMDLTDDLRDMLDAFRRRNLDVIVVDQTSPELRRNGLHCVKVLIPGMLPMSFGYLLTRVSGLERALRVPAELGYVPHPLSEAELNRYPHPFL